MPACSINWCKKSSKTSNLQKDGITFHLFPKNHFQRRKWTEVCNRPNGWTPTYSSSICSRHFEDSQFQVVPNNRRVLIKNAMPTLLLNKYELDIANMRHAKSIRDVMQKVLFLVSQLTTKHHCKLFNKLLKNEQKYQKTFTHQLPFSLKKNSKPKANIF